MLPRRDSGTFLGPHSTVSGNEAGKMDARGRRMRWEGSWTPGMANVTSKFPKISPTYLQYVPKRHENGPQQRLYDARIIPDQFQAKN